MVDNALGERGAWRWLLAEACAGRLLPTSWLNQQVGRGSWAWMRAPAAGGRLTGLLGAPPSPQAAAPHARPALEGGRGGAARALEA
jgi:hypothetical protein